MKKEKKKGQKPDLQKLLKSLDSTDYFCDSPRIDMRHGVIHWYLRPPVQCTQYFMEAMLEILHGLKFFISPSREDRLILTIHYDFTD